MLLCFVSTRISSPIFLSKMMLGRAALAHLRNSFQQHGHLRQLDTSSKSSEEISTKKSVDERMSTSSQRRRTTKTRRTSRTVSPSSTRRSSSVSTTGRRYSTSSAAIVDTDDDGVVLIAENSAFDGNETLSKFDLLHAVRYKLEHNEISRASSAEKRRLCSVLGDHLRCGDADLILYSAQV